MTVSVPPLPRMGSSGRPWQSLHWRLQRILALTFASALIVVFWAINWEIERTLVRVFEDRARGSAEQIANLVGPPVLHGIEQLQRLADQDSTFRDFLKHRSMTAVETLRATLARMGSNTPRRIALWPADGTGSIDVSVAASSGDGRELPAVPRPAQSGIGRLQLASAGVMFVDLAADVTDGGNHVGYLVLRSTLLLSPPGIVGRLTGSDARALLGNQDGSAWFNLSGDQVVAGPSVDLRRNTAVEFRDAGGARYLGAIQTIRETPWVVLVAFPRSVVVSPSRSIIWRAALLALVFAVAGAAALWTLTRTITAPLATMTEAAEAVAGGDYSRRIRPGRDDEIGRLGHAFDAMTVEVAEGYRQLESRVRDRTEALNEALKALREHSEAQQAYLAAIVESTDDAVIGQTLEGVIQSCNAAAERLYGYSASELIGQTILVLAPPDLHEEVRSLQRAIGAGLHLRDYETVLLRKDGSRIPVSITMSPIADRSGAVVGLAAVTRDIAARKALEEQLRQAQKMEAIGRLAGGIAHDFNNMLTAILGFSRFVYDSLPADDERRTELEEVIKAGERGAALTRQLLAFSRKQVVQPAPMDLNDQISETSRMLRRLVGEHVDLELRLARPLGLVRADPGQIDQILVNFATNAQDAMPSGGRLTIETGNVDLEEPRASRHGSVRPGAYVSLIVSDTGTGMTADTRAHLFEPFFTTKEQGKGTGLGLATVYGIVQQSGGYLDVFSEPGQGAAFTIYFPRLERESDADASAAVRSEAAPGGSETVLLVEDERTVRVLARTMLREAGYHVLEAASPERAEVEFGNDRAHVDALVTDIVMPGSSGPALYRRLSAWHPGLRVLYMSGYTDDVVFRTGKLEPGTAYLQKPFTAEALRRKLREVIDAGTRDAVSRAR